MDIRLLTIGKTTVPFIADGICEYERRLRHYVSFDIKSLPDIRNTRKLSESQQKQAEGNLLLNEFTGSDCVVLLDEGGREMTSLQFAADVQKRMASGCRRLVYVVGGPYGFAPEVYERANDKVSLSKLTFPHELVRLVFVEQLYRSFTILRNEPYHHR